LQFFQRQRRAEVRGEYDLFLPSPAAGITQQIEQAHQCVPASSPALFRLIKNGTRRSDRFAT